MARSPDGVRYYFDVAFAREAIPLIYHFFTRYLGGGSSYLGQQLILRQKVYLYPSRIEDRYGNWVEFNWDMSAANDARLHSIVANDGRRIDLGYKWIEPTGVLVPQDASGYKVETVTAAGKTWRYEYDTRSLLTKVTLPDTSAWVLSPTFAYPIFVSPGEDPCNGLGWEISKNIFEYTMKHPSGAQGKFLFRTTAHGRANVFPKCNWDSYWRRDKNASPGKLFASVSLHRKEISGPGLSPYVWTVQWDGAPANDASWQGENQGDTVKVVSVLGPNSTYTRYTFSNNYNRDEGRLLKEENGAGASDIKSVSEHGYDADASNPPFVREVGASPWYQGLNPLESRVIPQRSSKATRDGVIFERQVNAFDVFARPISVVRSSSLGGFSVEAVDYHDHHGLWVLGQVASVTTTSTVPAVVNSRVEYDPYAMPWKIHGPGTAAAPGQVMQVLTYDTTAAIETGQRGTVLTSADGRGYATTLSNWKRGVPQSIRHPDGGIRSALVNDAGWVTSITDEGESTTRYDYDHMGRVSLISYPDGDTTAWSSTEMSFSPTVSDEYGIAAGHWRQTVRTGAALKTTHFDALWRPVVEREEDVGIASSVRVSAKRYDHEGRVLDAYYAQEGSSTNYAQFVQGVHTKYDALGRVVEVKQDAENGQVLTTTTQYLPNFETLVTNPRQQQTRTRYAALDEPTYDYPVKQYLPEGVEVTIARDALFKPTQLTRSGGGLSVDRFYFYDQHQRLCRTLEPETGSTVTDYDLTGNVAWTASGLGFWGEGCHREDVADANRIKHTYNTRNWLTFTDYPAGTDDIALSYESTGEVRTAKLGDAAWTYARNKRGLVTEEALTLEGETRKFGYAYTPNGHLASVTYPRGRTIAFAPNALGQPAQAGSYVTDVRYWPEGDIKSMRYANGIAYSTQKNARRLPSNRTYASGAGALLYSQDLGYDPNANLVSVNDIAGTSPSRSKTMTYDGLDRLKTATAPGLWGTEGFTYDALDNIKTRVKDGQTYDYGYDGLNRLRDIKVGAAAVRSYWYDLQGNTICRQTDGCLSGGALTFDLANRLQRYNGLQSYQYDAWGRRVRKTSLTTGADTLSLYSQGGQLMVEHDSATNTISDYVYLGTNMVAKVSDTLPLLAAPSTSGGGFTLSWPASGAVRYTVEESANFGVWTTVYNGAASSWSAGGRTPGTYRYRVKACTADGACTTYTSTVTVKVMADLTPIIYELLLN